VTGRLAAGLRRVAAGGDVIGVVLVAALVTYPAGARVAAWCHVAAPWCWLYPAIADGLALVAYRATDRATGAGRGYAWFVVVVAAGMSAAGQAMHLAGLDRPAPTGLRAAVGAWPALAGAVAWHLRRVAGRPRAVTAGQAPATPVSVTAPDSAAAEPPAVATPVTTAVTGQRPATTAAAAVAPRPAVTTTARARRRQPAGVGDQPCPKCGRPGSARTLRRHRERGCPTTTPTTPTGDPT
jgi:hypothetical protein